MSNSNAAAIRRRATEPKQQFQQQSSQQSLPPQNTVNTPGLTLPQVIAVIDKRLISLESFAKETKDTIENINTIPSPSASSPDQETGVPKEVFNSVINEYNHRFEILAIEINNMKDIILKLQGFTMDVNKMLLDERTGIVTDTTLTISNPVLDSNDNVTDEIIEFESESNEIQDA